RRTPLPRGVAGVGAGVPRPALRRAPAVRAVEADLHLGERLGVREGGGTVRGVSAFAVAEDHERLLARADAHAGGHLLGRHPAGRVGLADHDHVDRALVGRQLVLVLHRRPLRIAVVVVVVDLAELVVFLAALGDPAGRDRVAPLADHEEPVLARVVLPGHDLEEPASLAHRIGRSPYGLSMTMPPLTVLVDEPLDSTMAPVVWCSDCA